MSDNETVQEDTAVLQQGFNLQIVTIGSNFYLGQVTEEGDKTILQNSLCCGTQYPTKENLISYLEAEVKNTLEKPTSIKGRGGMISVRDMSDDLAMELQVLIMRMEQARKQAGPELVAAKFLNLV